MAKLDLTPDVIAQLQDLLRSGALDRSGRTPERWGPLHNLNGEPTATFARPKFVWSAWPTPDQDTSKTYPYPRLLWNPEGVEITVYDEDAHAQHVAKGYLETNPGGGRPETPEERLQREFELLSPEDQAFVLEAAEEHRKANLAKMAGAMNQDLLAKITQTPVKRGPGRPRKTE